MIKRLFILFLITGFSVSKSFCCDCYWGGPFIKVTKETPLVALVKVTKHLVFRETYNSSVPIAMAVEIVDIYKGTENRKKVLVWGNGGHQCKEGVSSFDLGQYYVIGFF